MKEYDEFIGYIAVQPKGVELLSKTYGGTETRPIREEGGSIC
jgi:hypothetical protein